VNRKDVRLDFDVTKLGPSGLGSVEVYVTTDEGASWTPMSLGPDAVLAPEINGPGKSRGSVVVPLTEEGKVYGFSIVVKSKVGRGKKPPESGEAPQIRIERDTVAPVANFMQPMPDANRRDSLLLTWTAEDKNLAPNPITLQWSKGKDGPWTFIGGAEMPNSGKYSWQVPPDVPPFVYLKLTVRDLAGNLTVAQSMEPVPVDLSEPEVGGVSISRH
jgi:hypothetical protein